jgi:hypothetical protein
MVSNELIRNKNISLKAKGLYALIQSYITMENFTLYKGYLMNNCKEGEKAFESAWKELKDSGYLVQYKMQDSDGKFFYEYDLLDILPVEKPPPQNSGMDSHTPKKEVVDNADVGKRQSGLSTSGQWGEYNNTIQNNTDLNNTLSNHISITEDDVKKQIEYDIFNTTDKGQVDNIVMLMTEILNTADTEIIRVNSQNISAHIVKQRFKQITHSHIQYVLLIINNYTGHIDNIRQYMITTLYNAPSTIDIYYQNRVMNDMYNNERGENDV